MTAREQLSAMAFCLATGSTPPSGNWYPDPRSFEETADAAVAEGIASFVDRACAALLAVDPVEWALAGQRAGHDAANLIRRLAQPDTREQP